MIIENVDALKSWLAKLLEPICDADPSALANYVVALVKKDKPEKELKAFCADQLDVFLQKETSGFVDKLFESLYTKDYLAPNEPAKPELKPAGQGKEEIKEETFQETFEEEREGKKKKYTSPLKTRSDSNEQRTRERKRDDGKWRDYDRYYDRNDVYRDKYDWRRGRSKSRSKSRGLSRSRSRSRGRSKDQDANKDRDANRNVEHRERAKFKCERSDMESSYNPVSLSSVNSTEQYSSGAQCIPSAVTVIAPAHHPENTTESWSNYYSNHSVPNSFVRSAPPKQRCRDYDERGFCVLGDLCQFDHGNDPLVVDEVSLPSMIPFPPPPPGLPPPGMLMPPTRGPAHNMRMPGPQVHPRPPPPVRIPIPRPPLSQSSLINSRDQPGTTPVPSLAPVGARLPPPLPQNLLYSVSEHTYEPDGYNPEAPSITSTGRSQYRQFFSRTPMQRPNLIGLTSGDMDTNPRAANIIIQTEPPVGIASNSSNVSRVVLEPDNRKRLSNTVEGPSPKKPWITKQANNQNKPGFLKKNQYTNTKLEVRKIPPELNNITQLNEHFSKFGTIVNIQVAFKNDPEAALIQYLTNDEARKAISSTEAVLNNRFIRVLWHRENSEQQPLQPSQQQQQQTPAPLHHQLHLQQQLLTQTPPVTKPLTSGSYVLNKSLVKHRLGATGGNQPESQHSLPSQSTASTEDAQEAMKLQQDMRKKKQEMLEKQIECQKMLISKLEKKTMKPEERAELMKTLKELTVKISQLKDELKTSSATSTSKLKSNPHDISSCDGSGETLEEEPLGSVDGIAGRAPFTGSGYNAQAISDAEEEIQNFYAGVKVEIDSTPKQGILIIIEQGKAEKDHQQKFEASSRRSKIKKEIQTSIRNADRQNSISYYLTGENKGGKNIQKNCTEEIKKMTDSFKEESYEEEPATLESKMKAALKAFVRNKALGVDKTPVEPFQAAENALVQILTNDTILLTKQYELKQQLMTVKEESAKAGLQLNIKNTKIMCTEELQNFTVNNEETEIGKDFADLGSVSSTNGDCTQEIRRLELGRIDMEELEKIIMCITGLCQPIVKSSAKFQEVQICKEMLLCRFNRQICVHAQKELLDAELDFHKRLSSGEDTTELRKKLTQLQVEAARLGILPVGHGKAVSAQSRGRGRGRGGRGRGIVNHMVVDHRPKALTIGGFAEEEKDELLRHFSKFGDIEGLQEEDFPLSVVLTFKSRSEAENAANQGLKFKDRRLQISWHKPKVPSVSTETEEEEPKEEETETSDLILPEDDDDDDEDEDESRSWRR
ncbi:RNA-binding protein 27 [Varanus komodoensis]|nr:RNA-binding protein 27 [Varanus komodoensis]